MSRSFQARDFVIVLVIGNYCAQLCNGAGVATSSATGDRRQGRSDIRSLVPSHLYWLTPSMNNVFLNSPRRW